MKTDLIHFILYVKNQEESCGFYTALLAMKPVLHVPGMTEFILSPQCKLGLMPNEGMVRLLGNKIKNPSQAHDIPRCELYLMTDDVQAAYHHALQCGARLLSEPAPRNWGHLVAYVADADEHIIAFAKAI